MWSWRRWYILRQAVRRWKRCGRITPPLPASTACRFWLAAPTRCANRERVAASRFGEGILADNAAFLRDVQRRAGGEMYVGALLGSRGDAYTGKDAPCREESRAFHLWEAERFARAGVDFLYAALMPAAPEAEGMALALQETNLPHIISFTIGADGCLADGTPIAEAIERIDNLTGGAPLCYMTNCVHPDIAFQALAQPFNRRESVHTRFLGIQANTSPLPYAELDNAEDLHTSDPEALARAMLKLRALAPLKIFGGCCGTDGRHLRAVARRIGGSRKGCASVEK